MKVEKAERPDRYGHAFIMLDADGDVFLRTRPGQGLLAQMTEPPVSDWTAERGDPRFPLKAEWRHRGQVVHVFTHFRLELEIWSATDPRHVAARRWLVGRPARAQRRSAAHRVPQGAGDGGAGVGAAARPQNKSRRSHAQDRRQVSPEDWRS